MYSLGIEFGSTRIKAILLNEDNEIIAGGEYEWENQLIRGNVWTYSLSTATIGLQTCYKNLKDNYFNKFNKKLTNIGAIGISGMMHGYLVFDMFDKQLAEFRTWRNTITLEASTILTKKLGFHIPQRWSSAHVYQAILNKEPEVKSIAFATTLAGYFHYLLTGKKVIGVGEASGIFPIDSTTNDYNKNMVDIYNELIKNEVQWKFEDIFPKVLVAGDYAGSLTSDGAILLDPSGDLKPGIAFCPPEGDMGTGMVATNSVLKNTGNTSIGTSSNLTIVTNKDIGIYEEIDCITTPDGVQAALVHVNNGTSELNKVEGLFKEAFNVTGREISDGELFSALFKEALKADDDLGSLVSIDYHSGEPITKFTEGRPLTYRNPSDRYTLANFMRMHIYSLCATIRIGLDILKENENICINKITGHGGFFKTKGVGDVILSAAIKAPVETLKSSGEGGPYGMALLASYYMNKKQNESLSEFLETNVFNHVDRTIVSPTQHIADGFDKYLEKYKKLLEIERQSIDLFSKNTPTVTEKIAKLKEDVYAANIRLKNEGLITLTWGNASKIDRDLGLIAIKPSGVDYDKLTADDIVLVDMNGNKVDSKLNPSSDTLTHLELYKSFKDIGSIVHTHSTFGVAFAQANKGIPAYGTTHADAFYGEVPCTRPLTKDEIENNYELNTGKVIVKTFENLDPIAIPGVLVGSHGPFTWGKDEIKSVDNAIVLEEIAKMAYITETVNINAKPVDKYLLDKHYNRKHGKNAYYGQKGDK